ncbi:MAG TPA: hypothetical protein VGL29_15395 [Blastocatellia bacterium]
MVKKRTLLSSLVLLILSSAAAAQTNASNDKSSATTITAAVSGERVRFTAPSSVVQIRLEVYDTAGKKRFDNEVRGGNVLDWRLQDGQAEPLADDAYVCVITVKSLGGRITQRIGLLTIEKFSASLQAFDASQMKAPQLQAIGPIEENASLTVLSGDDNRTTTVIAHNGEDGHITRGRGALSFRIGDFLSGRDIEQMRLTPEGSLGIGITHPRARLDVDGLIRASQGIMFPDGTIQTTAAIAASAPQDSTRQPQSGTGSKLTKPSKSSGGSGKGQNSVSPEFMVNEDLTVNGSIFFTTGFPRDIAMQNNTGGVRIYSAPSLTAQPQSAAIQLFGTGSAFPGQAYIDSGAHDNAAVIFRTAGTGGTIAERMRITSVGDVLVANKWRTETTTVNPGPVPGPPNLIGGFLGTGGDGTPAPGNRVTAGVVGAVIGGGGFNGPINFPSGLMRAGDNSNRVTDWFGTVGGGLGNRAGNSDITLDNAVGATVGGGQFNTASGTSSTVGGGAANTASGFDSIVGGGGANTASNSNSTVGGGEFNNASGPWSTVGGGSFNSANGTHSAVGGGENNSASGSHNTVGGGGTNVASGLYSTVAGGQNNTASGSLYSTVGGGGSNNASTADSTVGGGFGNTASGLFSLVPGGLQANATHYGEMALASGSFSAQGDAQTSVYTLRQTTTDATTTELFLDGISSRITIAPGRAISFDILVVAKTSSGTTAGHHFLGVIKNVGGTTSLVGSGIKQMLGANDSFWDVNVEADDTNDALVIKATGVGSTTIRWVATARTVEVQF